MKLRLALFLLRFRGPLDVMVFGDWPIEGTVVLLRAHRRYVTVWTLDWERRWDNEGEKYSVPVLSVERRPWQKVDFLAQTYRRQKDREDW